MKTDPAHLREAISHLEAVLVIASTFIATPLAWYIMRDWLSNFAYHVGIQWWVFFATGIGALIVALLTVSVQSLSAAMENPTKKRSE